jgi:hypothetical protein
MLNGPTAWFRNQESLLHYRAEGEPNICADKSAPYFGAITVVGMAPTGILTTFGLFYALSGAFCGVPMAVQPMKAASAAALIALATGPSPPRWAPLVIHARLPSRSALRSTQAEPRRHVDGWDRCSGDPGGCLTYRRGGGPAKGRVNLGRAGSIGRRRISRALVAVVAAGPCGRR